jgi:hypothetical protein
MTDTPRTCTECGGPETPHAIEKGQRLALCDACGYPAHHRPARIVRLPRGDSFEILFGILGHNGGIETEVDGEAYEDVCAKLDGREIRLTYCCNAPARGDLPRRRK